MLEFSDDIIPNPFDPGVKFYFSYFPLLFPLLTTVEALFSISGTFD